MELPAVKRKVGEAFLAAVDVCGIVFAGSGAALVAFVGKFMAAIVLAAIALGFFLRLVGRKRVPVASRPALPAWSRAVSAAGSIVLVASLVEATDLPVRFHQSGFQAWHWVLVAVALAVAYSLCMRFIGALMGRSKNVAPQP